VDAFCVELMPVGARDPAILFVGDNDRMLVLQGQWLRLAETYGAPEPDIDQTEETFNFLDPPHAFPTSDFVVTRLPQSGDVLDIRLAGSYVAPEKPVDLLDDSHEFGDSLVLDGTLETFESAAAEVWSEMRSRHSRGEH